VSAEDVQQKLREVAERGDVEEWLRVLKHESTRANNAEEKAEHFRQEVARLEARLAETERERDAWVETSRVGYEAAEARLAGPPDYDGKLHAQQEANKKLQRKYETVKGDLTKCNEKLRGHQASIERRKHNAAEQEARLARLERVAEAARILATATRDPYDQDRIEAAWLDLDAALAATEQGAEE